VNHDELRHEIVSNKKLIKIFDKNLMATKII